MCRGLRLIDARAGNSANATAVLWRPTRNGSIPADLHGLERVVLHLVEPLGVRDGDLRPAGIDIFRQDAAATLAKRSSGTGVT